MITVDEMRVATQGQWRGVPATLLQPLAGISTDSRALQAGEVFVALRGPHFDGHEYVGAAVQRGAVAAIVERELPVPEGFPLLVVADALEALTALARRVRAATRIPVVGITGSVGKTTTKDMTAALLQSRGPVLKTEGNLNNHIGLPLTLLRLRPEHTAAVVELGMSAAGEIAHLTAIARPDVAVITNVAPVHLEFFSSLDDIARAKAEILEGLGPQGVAVLGRDDPRLARLGARLDRDVVWFGTTPGCHLRASHWRTEPTAIDFEMTWEAEVAHVHLPQPGVHAMRNFLAAAAVARRLGLTLPAIAALATGLAASARRGRAVSLGGDVLLIDDSYNANPLAVESAAAVLATHTGRRRVAFLGDMLELGPTAPQLHRQVGEQVAGAADLLVGVGPLAAEIVEGARGRGPVALHHFADSARAAEAAATLVREGDVVLVKASRGVKAELIVDALLARFGTTAG